MSIDQQVVSNQVREVQQQYPGSTLSQNRLRVPIVSVGAAVEVAIPQRFPWAKPEVYLLGDRQPAAVSKGQVAWPGEWNAGWTLLRLVQTVEETLYWDERRYKPAASNDSGKSTNIDALMQASAQLRAANEQQVLEIDKLKEALESSKSRANTAKAELAAAEQRIALQRQNIARARVAELQSRISAYRNRSEELSRHYRSGSLPTEDFQREYAEVRSRLHLLESVLSRLS